MNILQQEDVVKGLPDQALMQQAQMPTGELPQFLVVSEIQRREKMRKSFSEAVPENSIKDQVLSSGIAAMNPTPDPLMASAMGAQSPSPQLDDERSRLNQVNQMFQGQREDIPLGIDRDINDPFRDQRIPKERMQEIRAYEQMQQGQPIDPMMQQQMMSAAGGGMMPYRMQGGRDAPNVFRDVRGEPASNMPYYPRMSKAAPGLTQEQLNAILADGVSEEEAQMLSGLGVNFEDIALGQRGTFNPLNIRTGDSNWEGSNEGRTQSGYQGFNNVDDGLRAGAKVLDSYGRKIFNPENSDLRDDGRTNFETYGESIDTLAETIGRFAPPSDNNPTESYVNFLSERLGIAPNEQIDLTDPAFRSVLLSQMAELETDSIYSPQDITERIARANALIDSSNESLKTANTSNAVLEDTARAKEEDVVGGAELITAPSTRGAREVEELLSARNNINDNFETKVDSLLSGLPRYSPASSIDRQYTTSVESIAPNVGEYIRNYTDNVDFNKRRTQGRDPSFVVDSSNLASLPGKSNNNLINEGLGQTMPEDLVSVLQSVPNLTDQDSSNNTRYTNEDFIRANLDSAVQMRQEPTNPLEMFSKEPTSSFVEMPKYPDIDVQARPNLKPITKPYDGIMKTIASLGSGNNLLSRNSMLASTGYEKPDINAELATIDERIQSAENVLLLGFGTRSGGSDAAIEAQKKLVSDLKAQKALMLEQGAVYQEKSNSQPEVFAKTAPVITSSDDEGDKEGISILDSYKLGDAQRAKELARNKALANKNKANELRNEYLGLDEIERDPQAAGSGKRSFLGSDPVLGGLALAQLGAGIAQGDLGAGLSGAAKLLSDERTSALDRKSREEYYKALTNKASNSTKLSYDDAFTMAGEFLRKDLLTGMDVTEAQVHELAIRLMERSAATPVAGAGVVRKPPVPGGSGGGRSNEEILNEYIK